MIPYRSPRASVSCWRNRTSPSVPTTQVDTPAGPTSAGESRPQAVRDRTPHGGRRCWPRTVASASGRRRPAASPATPPPSCGPPGGRLPAAPASPTWNGPALAPVDRRRGWQACMAGLESQAQDALAATVEHVARLHGHSVPAWVEEPERFIDSTWVLSPIPQSIRLPGDSPINTGRKWA